MNGEQILQEIYILIKRIILKDRELEESYIKSVEIDEYKLFMLIFNENDDIEAEFENFKTSEMI